MALLAMMASQVRNLRRYPTFLRKTKTTGPNAPRQPGAPYKPLTLDYTTALNSR